MNIKLKAAGITAALIVAGTVITSIIQIAFTPDQVLKGIGLLCIVGLVYVFYKLVLINLEYTQKLQEINDSRKVD